jgi:guanylate kinase
MGRNVILDIDVKGGVNVKQIYQDQALSIFIQPPSVETLRQRLISRGTESDDAVAQRVARAKYEISFAPRFDQVVVNDQLETAVDQTELLISQFLK